MKFCWKTINKPWISELFSLLCCSPVAVIRVVALSCLSRSTTRLVYFKAPFRKKLISCSAIYHNHGIQGDLFIGLKNQQPHKRYQSSEPRELNAIHGKNDNADIFDELQADVYENLVRLMKGWCPTVFCYS